MNKIIIMADSTCDLNKEYVEANDVKIIPLHVTIDGDPNQYLDGVNLTSEEVYKLVEKYGHTPKTGARNVAEFISDFEPYIKDGYDIIYTGIGSGLSSTYNNAVLASKEFPEGRIEVVDSQNLSTGIGLLVNKMVIYRNEGLDIHEIAKRVREHVPLVSAKFCIDRLDYLYKGGRYVTDSGHMDGEDEYIIKQLSKYIDKNIIEHTHAGCVISSHCGPKTIGILYILKHPVEEK